MSAVITRRRNEDKAQDNARLVGGWLSYLSIGSPGVTARTGSPAPCRPCVASSVAEWGHGGRLPNPGLCKRDPTGHFKTFFQRVNLASKRSLTQDPGVAHARGLALMRAGWGPKLCPAFEGPPQAAAPLHCHRHHDESPTTPAGAPRSLRRLSESPYRSATRPAAPRLARARTGRTRDALFPPPSIPVSKPLPTCARD